MQTNLHRNSDSDNLQNDGKEMWTAFWSLESHKRLSLQESRKGKSCKEKTAFSEDEQSKSAISNHIASERRVP